MKKSVLLCFYIKSGKSIIKSIEQRHTVLRQFAAIAYKNGCTLQQLFSDVAYMSKVNDAYVGVSYQKAIHIKAFLTDCFSLQQQYPLLIPAFSTYKPIEHLAKLAAQLRLQLGKVGPQTKVIPSRLYIALINALADKLNEFNQNATALLKWFQRKQLGCKFCFDADKFKREKNAVSFADARDLLGLTALFENNQIQKHANLTRYMTLIQGMAKLWIHLFTGMRDNEVNQLSSDCYQTVQSNEHLVHVIMGYTSKLHGGGNKSTYWITFEDIQIGVHAAQSIGEIYALFNPHYDMSNPAEYPLFPTLYSQKHRNKNNSNIEHETDFISNFEGAPTRTQSNFNQYLSRISVLLGDGLKITESDIAELEAFDGFRNWREERTVKLVNIGISVPINLDVRLQFMAHVQA